MTETEKIGAVIVTAVKAAQAPLLEEIGRLKALVGVLETRAPIVGEKGRDGKDGRDGQDALPVDPAEVARLAVELIPAPKDGRDGQDGLNGKDAEPLDLAVVTRLAADLIPVPAAGRDGIDGKNGQDGKDANADAIAAVVFDSLREKAFTRDEVAAIVESEVTKAVAVAVTQMADFVNAKIAEAVGSMPKPRDGKDGVNGQDGKSVDLADVAPLVAGEVEKAVAAMPRAKDGLGVLGALIDRDGQLVVTLSDGTTKQLGAVVGRDVDMAAVAKLVAERVALIPVLQGAAGKDGRDGTLENLKAIYDGERTVTLCFKNGDPIDGGVIKFPVLIYRGIYEAGKSYEKGDSVTQGGAVWIAKDDTEVKPDWTPTASKSWWLAAKAGRDGKEGKPGKDGANGRDGKDFGPLSIR